MENLIPFLLFVIFGILSAVAKAKKNKKKKKSAKARERKGLAGRIHAVLADLQKRIETQSKNAPKGKFEWERLMDRSQPKSTDATPHDDTREDIDLEPVKEPPPPPPKATPIAAPSQPYTPIQASEKPDAMAVETPRMTIKARRKTTPSVLPTSRSDLRQAVVWIEILGPPIALRDPISNNR